MNAERINDPYMIQGQMVRTEDLKDRIRALEDRTKDMPKDEFRIQILEEKTKHIGDERIKVQMLDTRL